MYNLIKKTYNGIYTTTKYSVTVNQCTLENDIYTIELSISEAANCEWDNEKWNAIMNDIFKYNMTCIISTTETFSIKKDDILIIDNKLSFRNDKILNINYTDDYKYLRVYDVDFDSNITIEDIINSEELSKKFLNYGETGQEIYDFLTNKIHYHWNDVKDLGFFFHPFGIEFDYEEV